VKIAQNRWFIAGFGFLLGALVMLGVRFATYQLPEKTHYHANFAVYINGEQEKFASPKYYSEVALCSESGKLTDPRERAHMHDNVYDVVHVHDNAVTWGMFFQNLGWVIDPSAISGGGNAYTPDDQHKITFMLNGQKADTISQKVIKDEDRLLVSYGNGAGDELQKESKSVASTAHKYDITPDPASCSGGQRATTVQDRLNHLF
jgi:hypothetical protein